MKLQQRFSRHIWRSARRAHCFEPLEPRTLLAASISISDVVVIEGVDSQAFFTVNLSAPLTSQVSVEYATADDTALAGINYVSTSGTLSIAPGETQRTITVPILNDGTTHPVEAFTINLSNAVGAAIDDGQGIGTIEDADLNDLKLTLRVSGDGETLEIFLGNPVSPGETPFTWPMNATEPLTIETDLFEPEKGHDEVFVELPPGTDGPAGGIVLDAGLSSNELHVRSGKVRIDSTLKDGTLKTTVAEGAELITARLDQNEVQIDGRLSLLPGSGTSTVRELALGPVGVLDLADNALVVNYTGGSPIHSIREKILSGRGGAGLGGSWTGPGITSTTVAAANKVDPEAFSIGYADNETLPLGEYTNFRGLSVDESSVLIAYTRTGDANLDGVVDDDDVTIVGATYASGVPQPHWALGDFDYNGFVDDDDVTLLGVFYGPGAAPVGQAPRDTVAAVAISIREMTPLAELEVYDNVVAEREGYDNARAIQHLLAAFDDAFAPKRKQNALVLN